MLKYAEGKNGSAERWEFKIQRESGEKRGGRLTNVRWCMRNLVYSVADLLEKWRGGHEEGDT